MNKFIVALGDITHVVRVWFAEWMLIWAFKAMPRGAEKENTALGVSHYFNWKKSHESE